MILKYGPGKISPLAKIESSYLDNNHKMIEDLDKRLCHARKTSVEAKEKDIVFGKD